MCGAFSVDTSDQNAISFSNETGGLVFFSLSSLIAQISDNVSHRGLSDDVLTK